jgi:hypothetical protein
VRRKQPDDTRSASLNARCANIMTRGFKRP